MATIYQDCPFAGTAVSLPVGEYTMDQLAARGMPNNKISSLRVSPGYEVELFLANHFSEGSRVFGGDTEYFDETWNGKVSSLKVRTAGVTDLSGVYTVQNRNSGLFLDVAFSSQDNGAAVHQWTSNNGGSNQQFRFIHLGEGVYEIQAVHSGKALDVTDVSTTDGALVHQWDYVGQAHQQFIVQDAGGGYYRLVAKHSGKVLEVGQSSTAVGADVQQWANNGSATQ